MGPPISTLIAEADAKFAQGNLRDAAAVYRAALLIAPDHPGALHALGWITHLSGDDAEAAELLRRSVAADPNAAGCWNNLGIVCAAARRWPDAEEAYRRALAIQPNFPAALLNLGNALRDQRRWPDAVEAYGRAVGANPGFAAAHHALGTALREVGRTDEAVAAYRRAMELDPPAAPAVLNDVGLTLARRGDWRGAEEHFRRASALAPQDSKPRRNLGRLLLRLGRFADAAQVLTELVRLRPESAEAHNALGTALARSGRLDDAVGHFLRAVAVAPGNAEAQCNLGVALEEKGDRAGAAAAFARAKALRPDSEVIAYHYAALSGRDAPPACPPQYLVELFDGYADRFDQDLVGRLGYAGPRLLRDALAPLRPGADAVVIDIGCGTGLCGEMLRPMASRLIGIDLSPGMLNKARERNVYDELVLGDMASALAERAETADVVTAGDVFIYVGDIAPVVDAVSRALKPGGLFAFTVETPAESEVEGAAGGRDGYVLRPTRRYAHGSSYVRRVARAQGLEEVDASTAVLRGGGEAGVDGTVFVFRKSNSH